MSQSSQPAAELMITESPCAPRTAKRPRAPPAGVTRGLFSSTPVARTSGAAVTEEKGARGLEADD